MYLGEINHGQSSCPGEHPAIVDKAAFDEAQEILARMACRLELVSEMAAKCCHLEDCSSKTPSPPVGFLRASPRPEPGSTS
jgi:hypothetical protein